MFRIYFYKILIIITAAYACLTLQDHFNLAPMLTSSIVALLFTFLPAAPFSTQRGMEGVALAGTFIAMCSREVINDHLSICALAFIVVNVYFLAKPHFKSFGGKIGTIVFISVLTFLLLKKGWG